MVIGGLICFCGHETALRDYHCIPLLGHCPRGCMLLPAIGLENNKVKAPPHLMSLHTKHTHVNSGVRCWFPGSATRSSSQGCSRIHMAAHSLHEVIFIFKHTHRARRRGPSDSLPCTTSRRFVFGRRTVGSSAESSVANGVPGFWCHQGRLFLN